MPVAKTTKPISISNGTIIRTLLFIILIYALYILRDIILIVLTSIVLASFISATANKLSRFRLNRTVGVVLVYVLALSMLSGLFYLFAPIVITEISNLSPVVQKYYPAANIPNLLSGSGLSGAQSIFNNLGGDGDLSAVITGANQIASKVTGGFFGLLATMFGGLLNFILIIVISFYLSIQENGVEKFLRIIVPSKHEPYIIGLWSRTQRKIALWVKGQLLLGILVGILIYLGLTILNVPYALLLSFAAAIFELIPFGIILGAIPAIIFSFMQGGFTLALIVAGFYTIVQQFENYLLQPLVIKKVVGISPLVIILSVLIGYALAGFWGLILAVPAAVCVLELTNDIEKKKAGTSLIS